MQRHTTWPSTASAPTPLLWRPAHHMRQLFRAANPTAESRLRQMVSGGRLGAWGAAVSHFLAGYSVADWRMGLKVNAPKRF